MKKEFIEILEKHGFKECPKDLLPGYQTPYVSLPIYIKGDLAAMMSKNDKNLIQVNIYSDVKAKAGYRIPLFEHSQCQIPKFLDIKLNYIK